MNSIYIFIKREMQCIKTCISLITSVLIIPATNVLIIVYVPAKLIKTTWAPD